MSRSSRSDFGRRNVSPVFCFLTVWTMILSSVHYHLCFARVLQWASTLSSGLNWSSGWQEWNTHTHTTEPGQWIGLKHIGESMYMHYKYIYIYSQSMSVISYPIISYHINYIYMCWRGIGGEWTKTPCLRPFRPANLYLDWNCGSPWSLHSLS